MGGTRGGIWYSPVAIRLLLRALTVWFATNTAINLTAVYGNLRYTVHVITHVITSMIVDCLLNQAHVVPSAKRSTAYIARFYHVWTYLCANLLFWGDIWSRFDPYMAEVP